LLGVGPNNFGRAYSALPTALPGGGQRRLLHTTQVLVPPYAENLYLHVLAEEGILGLAAYLALVAAALLTVYRGARAREPAGRALAFGIGAALLTISFHGVVQVTLFTELMFPVFALLGVAGRIVTLDWEADRAGRAARDDAPAQAA
jgi:O-antigen ligase